VYDPFDWPSSEAGINERVNEAGLKAEGLYELIIAADPDTAVELLRELLREMAMDAEMLGVAKFMLRDAGLSPPKGVHES
jgi:hypothetical protein